MLLWTGFAILTAAVVAALLRPLLADGVSDDQAPGGSGPDASAAVYRDQLAEIEDEHERGLIGDAEAEAARVEIARRLLAAADTADGALSSPAAVVLRTIAVVVAATLPVLAIAAYLAVGSPGLPGQPFAERGLDTGNSRSVDQLIATVEERLRIAPEDGRGWDVIAPAYLQAGRYREAADAFEHALRLVGESPDRLAGLAESHVLANDGLVTEAARKPYERLRALAPERVEPHFWLAVAAEQDSRLEDAVKVYARLLTESEADAKWRPTVAERWRAVRRKLGLATHPLPDGKAEARSSGLAPSLSKEAVRAVQSLPEETRRQMIEDMVASLDKRLREDGRDLEGWQRLIRAYVVLGRREDALAALARARAALAGEAPSLEALGALALGLGLPS